MLITGLVLGCLRSQLGPGQPARAAWRLACAPADLIQQGCGGGPEGPVLAPRAAVTRRQDWRERIVEGGRGDESEDSRESAGQASVQRGSPAGAGLKMPEPALLCEASSGWALGDSVPLTSCKSSPVYLGPAGHESEDLDSISELSRWKSS